MPTMAAWGVDATLGSVGGLQPPPTPARRIHMFQRKLVA
ncbi:MAG: hypothetical protein RLZZ584_1712, partial [Pseudomonadota bacterium]